MCILLLSDRMLYIYICISIKYNWSNVSFKASILLFIFCLDYLSIYVRGVLKSPPFIVLLSMRKMNTSILLKEIIKLNGEKLKEEEKNREN